MLSSSPIPEQNSTFTSNSSVSYDEDPNFARINYIHFESDPSSPFVRWTMKGLYGNYTPVDSFLNGWFNYVQNGIYTISIDDIEMATDSAVDCISGLRSSNSEIPINTIINSEAQVEGQFLSIAYTFETTKYITNTTYGEHPVYSYSLGSYFSQGGLDATFHWSRYDDSGSFTKHADSSSLIQAPAPHFPYHIGYTYDLGLLLQVDASYFALDDFRIETYTPYPEDYTVSQEMAAGETAVGGFHWIQQNPHDIRLDCPYYKLRVINDVSDEVVFEDDDWNLYSKNRTVYITDLEITNNADELINVSLMENGQYQSSMDLSWDLKTPNTQPDNLQYSEDSFMYLQNEYQDHNKIMYCEGQNISSYNYKTQYNVAKNGVKQWNSSSYNYKKNPFYPYNNIDGVFQWGSGINPDYSGLTIAENANTVDIVSNKDGHKDVLYVEHQGVISDAITIRDYWDSGQSSGTVELYFYIEDVSKGITIKIGSSAQIDLYNAASGMLEYYDGSGWVSLYQLNDNQWYHLRVDFECGSGAYSGLAADTFQVNIDGSIVGNNLPFASSATSLSELRVGTRTTSIASKSWYDAFSYTFEGYTIEDNRHIWEFNDYSDLGCIVDIDSEKDGHEDVLRIEDQSTSGLIGLGMNLDDSYKQLYFSFWFNSNATISYNHYTSLRFYRDSVTLIEFLLCYSGVDDIRVGASTIETDVFPKQNQWYLLEFYLNDLTDEVSLMIDNILIGVYNLDYSVLTGCNAVSISSRTSGSGYASWFDELYYSNSDFSIEKYISDSGFGINFNETYYSGSFEWWQNNAINSSILYLGNCSLNFTENELSIWNSTDFDIIESINQLDNYWKHYQIVFNNSGVFLYRNSFLIYSDSFKIIVSQFQLMNIWNGKLWVDAIDYKLHSGNYLGTHSWENETELNDWTIETDYEIISTYNSHSSVMHISDALSDAKRNNLNIETQTNGMVELYGCELSSRGLFGLATNDVGSYWSVLLRFTPTSIRVYHGASWGFTDVSVNYGDMNHIKVSFDCVLDTQSVWINNINIITNQGLPNGASIDSISYIINGGYDGTHSTELYLDAIDYLSFNGYYEGRNLDVEILNENYIENQNTNVNNSQDLWCWNAFPNWESGCYQHDGCLDWGVYGNADLSQMSGPIECAEVIEEYNNHKNVLQSTWSGSGVDRLHTPTNEAYGTVDLEFYAGGGNNIYLLSGGIIMARLQFDPTTFTVRYGDGSGGYSYEYIPFDGFSHFKFHLDFYTDKYSLWVNDFLEVDNQNFEHDYDIEYFTRLQFALYETTPLYFDAFGCDFDDYWIGQNKIESSTISSLNMNYNLSTLINPYSKIQTDFECSNYFVDISDMYGNNLEVQTLINSTEANSITYTPAETRECFISIRDQQSNYIEWEKFRIYVNDTLLYSNLFYREIGTTWNISFYDDFDLLIYSTLYTVERDSNYLGIQLTLHSLKIFNQQECFNYINITRDPNYYESDEYWSEWLAPNEIANYHFLPGYYRVQIESNEDSSTMDLAYHLVSDDILLITSENTISNAIYSLTNVNTTLGNQITAVNISIVNTQSEIQNQIVSVEINLDNINTTLGDQLISIDTLINNLDSDLENLYWFTNQSLVNLNVSMNEQFVGVNTQITNINDSISLLVVGIDNSLNFMHSDLNTSLTQISNDVFQLSSNINVSLIEIDSTIDQIGDNITSNYVLLNNSLNIQNSMINQSQINILNQLMLINSSIMDSITEMYNSVYMINNSLYTATIDLGTALSLQNNNIMGNLSFYIEKNPELNEIYTNTLFSENLTFSRDVDFVRSQTDGYNFLNQFTNQSLEVQLKYGNKVKSLQLGSDDVINQAIKNTGVEYRAKSIETGEYLENWTILDNQSIKWGYRTDTYVPQEVVVQNGISSADFIIAVVYMGVGVIIFVAGLKTLQSQNLTRNNSNRRTTKPKKRNPTVRDNSPLDAME